MKSNLINAISVDLDNPEIIQDIVNNNIEDVFFTSKNLIENLLTMELGFKNKNIAIVKILKFLRYIDYEINKTNESLIQISKHVLVKHFNSNEYTQYLKLLSKLEIMTKVPYEDGEWAKIGERPSQFRIHSVYIFNSEFCIVTIRKKNKKSLNDTANVHKKFKNAILNTEIDYDNAFKAEIKHFKDNGLSAQKLRIRLSSLFRTVGERYISYGEKVDRISHSFSNMSRVSREYLYVNGMKYNDIDIVNCQPLLLAYVLKSKNMKYDEQYIQDCENGVFYEHFVGITDKFLVGNKKKSFHKISTLDRENAKIQVYRSILFKFKDTNPVNLKFKELYPKTHESLSSIPKTISMASILQNAEAEIFNSIIPKYSEYFFTLYDAIYFTSKMDIEAIKEELEQKFNKLGIKVKFKENIRKF
jgi:hypothetical protein